MTKQLWISQNLRAGEVYAGIVLGQDGKPDHHLILLAPEATDVTWAKAKDFAKKAGGELPTRSEQALLYANLKKEFQPRWYWSCEQHAASSDCAWGQGFLNGLQYNYIQVVRGARPRGPQINY